MTAGTCRLPAPAGTLIDRGKPVTFRFEGRSYRGFLGDTLASALAAHGVQLLSRSFKYHRPRGLLTAAGQDGHSLVQLGDVPNALADRVRIQEGLSATGQHYRGSLEKDQDAVLEKLGRFMPAGFYYRAFFRPRGIWQKFWEPVFRARAGLGRISTASRHDAYFEKQHLFCQVAVIGAGPAGLSAAIAAAQTGAEVLLVDDNSTIGGSLNYARFDAAGQLGRLKRDELAVSLSGAPKITVMSGAVATGWFADNWLALLTERRLYKLRAEQVIFATGSIEQPIVFRNNDLPGIIQGSAAQRLIRLYGVKPGSRAVILTGNDGGYGVALDLADAGVDIAAIADLRAGATGGPMAYEAGRRGLPVKIVRHIDEALADATGLRVGGCILDGQKLACDLVCMSPGFAPAYQLPAQAGARVGYDADTASFVVGAPPDNNDLAGSVNGYHALEAVCADGARAGVISAGRVGLSIPSPLPEMPRDDVRKGINLPWPIFPHPAGKEFVDFDEDLQIQDIIDTAREGYNHLELLKRFSTVGMGPSQGRQSALNTARLLARETGASLSDVAVTTARPPTFGEPLALLAGQSFAPERLTPMHDQHLERGAHMMAVGAWWRPAFYGAVSERDRVVAEEVTAIRRGVGLIDVSTLGKIAIQGPDAAEFLDRMYTFTFAKQPVGRIRYLLMTNEAGTVIDDGVAARLGADHFYLTATTGAVDNTFRQMQFFNAQWRLKIDIANLSVGFAAVNLAGPKSREVLSRLVTDIDLSPSAFPYLAVREGTLAGIPVRMLRIGFVGELGYEIHVPNQLAEALWNKLLEAGAPDRIRPVGLDAQRVLRLEKGHIIIGQDTDGLTTPTELGMDWAVSHKKPFFVGARSLQLRSRQQPKRQLVGFTLPLSSPVPEESYLVVDQGEMAGVVTSAARSETCGKVIGMAYVKPEMAAIGSTISIRLLQGKDVEATVAALPFYDPELARQNA